MSRHRIGRAASKELTPGREEAKPGIERHRNFTLQKAELQGRVGRGDPLRNLVLPGKLLAGPDIQLSPCRYARVEGRRAPSPAPRSLGSRPGFPSGHDSAELTGTALWTAMCAKPGNLWTSPSHPVARLWIARTFHLARHDALRFRELEAAEKLQVNSLSCPGFLGGHGLVGRIGPDNSLWDSGNRKLAAILRASPEGFAWASVSRRIRLSLCT
jgi:hypothetical protein